ncbi:MAG: hypothetical protein OJJ21_22285 [Ferrovibrio sp.]|uniref:hypothetical protein n=1 Tax=Ferrovibrio sp. TaxID=1917215 RepID=UPI00262CB31B|nr:hypothetical protein [Ferrovibrio sp.]MCW0236343.1 hypothetical protein [Ferrovibrio sp.]
MIDVSKIVNGVTAPEWEKKGKTWDPSLHFTAALSDKKYVSEVNQVLAAHGDKVAAFFLYEPLPGGFSLELQFATPEAAKEARTMWYAFDQDNDNEDEEDVDEVSAFLDEQDEIEFLIHYKEDHIRLITTLDDVDKALTHFSPKIQELGIGTVEARLHVWQMLKGLIESGDDSEELQISLVMCMCYLAYVDAEHHMDPSDKYFISHIYTDNAREEADEWGDFIEYDEAEDVAFVIVSVDNRSDLDTN